MNIPPIVRLLRPNQYAKNLLVFSAPGAAGRLDELAALGRASAAFVFFCAVSSAGYVANDLADVEADRRHPRKRQRPIAAGHVPVATARAMFGVLLLGALLLSPLLGWWFSAVLAGYAALTLTYSGALKRIPWIELATVSAGFLLRALGGGAATDTPISRWFLLVVSGGALLLITGKRIGELLTLGSQSSSRAVLADYSATALRNFSGIAAVIAIGGYAAWTIADAGDRAGPGGSAWALRLTILPFIVAMTRYVILSWRGGGETPEVLVVRDPVVVGAGACWATLYAIGLYA